MVAATDHHGVVPSVSQFVARILRMKAAEYRAICDVNERGDASSL
jgi:hypothetical protein